MKEFLPKCTVLKVDLLYDHLIYYLQACMRAIFSPEVLQAGAVKGLISRTFFLFFSSFVCSKDIDLKKKINSVLM